jgi:hypothetical protein
VSQQDAARIAIEAIFYTSILFTAAVSMFWPWWRSQLGWSIIAKSFALAVAVLPAMIAYWFGTAVYARNPWLGWLSIAAMATIPLILVWRAAVLWHVQRAARQIL